MKTRINWNSKWAKMPRWKKRLAGVSCYFIAMIVSIWNPELIDFTMYNTLSKQFYKVEDDE
jgi:hypothetical protein